MSFIFKYQTFFNYYEDPANTFHLSQPIDIWNYIQVDRYTGQWMLSPEQSTSYITIDRKNIYITKNKKNWLFFNIPRLVDGKYLGDHFSIGFKTKYGKTIDLHFTKQNELGGTSEHDPEKRCFFNDGIVIDDILNLECQQPNGGMLHEHFSTEEVEIIMDILQRPFVVVTGGSKYLHHKYKRRIYRIFIGKKGGKYILLNGKKKYIKS